jgi:hypothetical protein
MTKGEHRVRITFNPNDNPRVTQLKQMAADLIDAYEAIPNQRTVK